MSGTGFGFDKGLLGPTSWAPSTTSPGQPPRNTAAMEFQTATSESQKAAPQAPAWPAIAQGAGPSAGDLRNYNTSDVVKDSAFADVKSYITGGR